MSQKPSKTCLIVKKNQPVVFFSCESQHVQSLWELKKVRVTYIILPSSQISRFTEIILDKDSDEEYKYFRVEEDPARPTLLHLAAGSQSKARLLLQLRNEGATRTAVGHSGLNGFHTTDNSFNSSSSGVIINKMNLKN